MVKLKAFSIKWTTIILLLLGTVAIVEAGGDITSWEISVDFALPETEHVRLFLNIKNTGNTDITGLEFALDADSSKFIETEQLTFTGDDEENKLVVDIIQENEKSVITLNLPEPILPGKTQQLLIDLETTGLLEKEGSGYRTRLKFDSPSLIDSSGKISTTTSEGSFRVHTPEGFIYTGFDPTPWREIWQGVSGFNAHFVLIFNGGTQFTTPITVTFQEDGTIQRAVEIYKALKIQEKSKTRSEEELNEANRRITDGANYVLLGQDRFAKTELDKAEAILTGKTVEEVIKEDIEDIEVIEPSSPFNVLYIIGGAIVALLIVLGVFGKNIISALKGGKEDEK